MARDEDLQLCRYNGQLAKEKGSVCVYPLSSLHCDAVWEIPRRAIPIRPGPENPNNNLRARS